MCWQNSIKLPEMKILSAFCVFLYEDRQIDMARLIDTSLEIFISNIPQKMDGENENCRYEYFMKLGLADTAFHMSK